LQNKAAHSPAAQAMADRKIAALIILEDDKGVVVAVARQELL
jgi:hypothetical protein